VDRVVLAPVQKGPSKTQQILALLKNEPMLSDLEVVNRVGCSRALLYTLQKRGLVSEYRPNERKLHEFKPVITGRPVVKYRKAGPYSRKVLKAVDKAIAKTIPPGTVLETSRGPIASEMKDHHVARGDGLFTTYPIPLSANIEPPVVVSKPLKRSEDPRYNKVIPVTTLVDYHPAPVSEEEKRQHVDRNIKSLVDTSHTRVDKPQPVDNKPEEERVELVERKVQGYANTDAKLTSYKDIHDTLAATKHGVNFGLTSTDERIINRMFEERQRYPKFSENELAQKMGLSVALVKSALRKIRNTADARAKVVC
jgi:hypothetical protein